MQTSNYLNLASVCRHVLEELLKRSQMISQFLLFNNVCNLHNGIAGLMCGSVQQYLFLIQTHYFSYSTCQVWWQNLRRETLMSVLDMVLQCAI